MSKQILKEGQYGEWLKGVSGRREETLDKGRGFERERGMGGIRKMETCG